MTDTTAAPVAPVTVTAPVTSETIAATPAAPEQPKPDQHEEGGEPQRLGRDEARRGLPKFADRMQARLSPDGERTDSAPAAPAAGAPSAEASPAAPAQPRRPDGTFAPVAGEASPDAPAVSQPAGEARPDAAPAAASTQPQPIRVPIDPNHPLARQGLAAFTAATEAEANAMRALLNGTYTSRRQVQEAAARADAAEDRALRLETSREVERKWMGTPEYAARLEVFQELRETRGEAEAQLYWQGAMGQLSQLTEDEYKTRVQAAQEERLKQHVNSIRDDARRAVQRFPATVRALPEFDRWFTDSWAAFDFEAGRGTYNHIDSIDGITDEFRKFMAERISKVPAVMQALKPAQASPPPPAPSAAVPPPPSPVDARTTAQIEKDAVDRFKRETADVRRTAPPHPLAAVASGSSSARVADGGAEAREVEQQREEMSTHELRRSLSKDVRKATKEFMGRLRGT